MKQLTLFNDVIPQRPPKDKELVLVCRPDWEHTKNNVYFVGYRIVDVCLRYGETEDSTEQWRGFSFPIHRFDTKSDIVDWFLDRGYNVYDLCDVVDYEEEYG